MNAECDCRPLCKRVLQGEGEMNHYLSRHLLVINEQVQVDPTFLMAFQKLFDWANEMGIKGIKVRNLTVVPPRSDCCIIQPCTVWCKQECTEEEENSAREHQQEMIRHAVGVSLQEDDNVKTAE